MCIANSAKSLHQILAFLSRSQSTVLLLLAVCCNDGRYNGQLATKASFDRMSMKQVNGKYFLNLRLFIAEPSLHYLTYF